MGIKDETPDDKVIFDSVDARMKYSKGIQIDVAEPLACNNCIMKYSKGIQIDVAEPLACNNCIYKENNPYKEPCGTCLSPLNDKNYYIKEGSVDAEPIKNDIVKTESELDIKLNKIESMLKDISYNLELLGDEIGKIEERLGI